MEQYGVVPEVCKERLLTKHFSMEAHHQGGLNLAQDIACIWSVSTAAEHLEFDPKTPRNSALGDFERKKVWFTQQYFSKWLKPMMFENKSRMPRVLLAAEGMLTKLKDLSAQKSFNIPTEEMDYMSDVMRGLRYMLALVDQTKLAEEDFQESWKKLNPLMKKKDPEFEDSFSQMVVDAVRQAPSWRELHDKLYSVNLALQEGQKRIAEASENMENSSLEIDWEDPFLQTQIATSI